MNKSTKKLLKKYVSKYSDVLESNGKVLFCKLCEKSVSFDKKFNVERHLKTEKHRDRYSETFGTENLAINDLLHKYVSENSAVFETDGKELFCKACDTVVSFDNMNCVDQHLTTEKHIDNCKKNAMWEKPEPNTENNDSNESDGKELKTHKHTAKYMTEPESTNKNTELLKKYVMENNEVFETDGKELFCKICNKSIAYDTKYSVHRHLKSLKHKRDLPEETDYAENKKRVKQTTADLLKRYVSENEDVFETDGELLMCKACKKSISFQKKYSVDQHLRTQKHQDNYASLFGIPCDNENTKYSCEGKEDPFKLEYNEDLCRTCMKQFSKTENKDDNKQRITEIPAGFQSNTSIKELLETIQPKIKINIKENLPTAICSECIKKLIVSYEFIEMYQNVDIKLRSMLKEFDIDNCNKNTNELQDALEEMEIENDIEETKYEIEIEQLNIDDLKEKEDVEDNECLEFENEAFQELSDEEENEAMSSNVSDDDEDWIPKQSWLNSSFRNDDATNLSETKNEAKEFSQSEEIDDGRLPCRHCEAVFDTVKLLREHMKQNHSEKKAKRAYNRRTNEPRKRVIPWVPRKVPTKEDGSYKCELCGKRYTNFIFYRTHMRLHTAEPLLCIECGKSFNRLSSFNTHMLRHKGEKNYQCPHCPKSFVCSSGLYGHMMIHTNNRPYICDTCGAAFHMAYQLRFHNLYHAGIKNFQCEYCDMRFVTKEKQKRHMRTHTGEKPFRCKYCERAFAQSNDCVKHLRQHLGDNVYQCDLCPLRFPLVRDLRVHFATHKDDDEETRARNLQAREEEERNLQIRLGSKETT